MKTLQIAKIIFALGVSSQFVEGAAYAGDCFDPDKFDKNYGSVIWDCGTNCLSAYFDNYEANNTGNNGGSTNEDKGYGQYEDDCMGNWACINARIQCFFNGETDKDCKQKATDCMALQGEEYSQEFYYEYGYYGNTLNERKSCMIDAVCSRYTSEEEKYYCEENILKPRVIMDYGWEPWNYGYYGGYYGYYSAELAKQKKQNKLQQSNGAWEYAAGLSFKGSDQTGQSSSCSHEHLYSFSYSSAITDDPFDLVFTNLFILGSKMQGDAGACTRDQNGYYAELEIGSTYSTKIDDENADACGYDVEIEWSGNKGVFIQYYTNEATLVGTLSTMVLLSLMAMF